jgi:hypothetical protein
MMTVYPNRFGSLLPVVDYELENFEVLRKWVATNLAPKTAQAGQGTSYASDNDDGDDDDGDDDDGDDDDGDDDDGDDDDGDDDARNDEDDADGDAVGDIGAEYATAGGGAGDAAVHAAVAAAAYNPAPVVGRHGAFVEAEVQAADNLVALVGADTLKGSIARAYADPTLVVELDLIKRLFGPLTELIASCSANHTGKLASILARLKAFRMRLITLSDPIQLETVLIRPSFF